MDVTIRIEGEFEWDESDPLRGAIDPNAEVEVNVDRVLGIAKGTLQRAPSGLVRLEAESTQQLEPYPAIRGGKVGSLSIETMRGCVRRRPGFLLVMTNTKSTFVEDGSNADDLVDHGQRWVLTNRDSSPRWAVVDTENGEVVQSWDHAGERL